MKRLLVMAVICATALGVALAVFAAEEEPGFEVDGAASAAPDAGALQGDTGPAPAGDVSTAAAELDGVSPAGDVAAAPTWTPPEGALPWGLEWPDQATISSLLAEEPVAATAAAAPADADAGAATPENLPGIAPSPIRPLEEGAEASLDTGIGQRIANLTKLDARLEARLEELERIEKRIQGMYAESVEARRFSEEACGGPVVTARTVVGSVPPTAEERDARLAMVTDIVKKMKPDIAANVLQEWDEVLAIRVLERLGARRASPVLSKMPVEVAGKLTRRMIAGEGAVRVGRPAGGGGL